VTIPTTTPLSYLGAEIYTALTMAGYNLAVTGDLSAYATTAALAGKQPLDATLTAAAAVTWTAGTQVLTLTAADTFTLLTVGSGTGNLLNKAAGDALYLPLASPTFTGTETGPRYASAFVAMPTSDFNHASGSAQTRTLSANTVLTESNRPAAGADTTFRLQLTIAGAFTFTPPATWIFDRTLVMATTGVMEMFGTLKSDGTGWRCTYSTFAS